MTATTASLAHLQRFLRCEQASTAIEYGIIASMVSLAIVPTLGALGGKLAGTFGAVADALNDGGPPPRAPADSPPGPPPGGKGG